MNLQCCHHGYIINTLEGKNITLYRIQLTGSKLTALSLWASVWAKEGKQNTDVYNKWNGDYHRKSHYIYFSGSTTSEIMCAVNSHSTFKVYFQQFRKRQQMDKEKPCIQKDLDCFS